MTKTKTKMKPIADTDEQNEDRASWARTAVEAFQAKTGLGEADGLGMAIMDLLTDLAHLCDEESLDLAHLLSRAQDHYEAETMPDDKTTVRGKQFDCVSIVEAKEERA